MYSNNGGGGNGSAKLNPQLVREMLRLRAEGWSYPKLARQFGVSENTVAKICRGTAWRSVTGGHEILTDGEAQLRALTTPMPSEEAIQASMERLQRLINGQEESSIPECYRAPQSQQDYERTVKELVENAKERTRDNDKAVPPPKVNVRYPESGSNAEQLLETLKDEHTNTVEPKRD